jgi:hypothetical protein
MNWNVIFQKGCNAFIDWGPGMLIAALVLYGLYRLTKGVGLKIVAALEKPADALNRQAESMDKLTGSIQGFVDRDRNEHREIIILQKVLADRFDHLEGRLIGREDDRGKERTV